MKVEPKGHISQEKIWAAVRGDRDLVLSDYVHVFNCGLCRRFLDVCVHSQTFEDALETFSESDITDTAA